MQKLIRLTLSYGLFILLLFSSCGLSQAEEISSLVNKLQNTFNNKQKDQFFNLFSKQIAKDLEKQYSHFIKIFPDAKWTIKLSSPNKGESQLIDILLIGDSNTRLHKYSLISNQKIAIKTQEEKIVAAEILSNYSILQSGSKKLDITTRIPDTVLTGSQYDIDIILNKPLEDRIIAGGLIAVEKKYFDFGKHQDIPLMPMASGGLFKSVRAPLEPGNQIWSALIAHPEGLISITKLVRVISSTDNLIPSKN